MASNEFQGMLYRTQSAMLDAIAEAWLTGGGLNDRALVSESLAGNDDAALAQEVITAWELDQPSEDSLGADAPSHMAREGYDADDLADAFGAFRAAHTGGE